MAAVGDEPQGLPVDARRDGRSGPRARCSSTPNAPTSARRRTGAWIPDERFEVLDAEGIDAAVLYTTIGLLWEAELDDAELSPGVHAARTTGGSASSARTATRLVPTAHLSLSDPAAAARELERAVGEGARGAYVAPFTHDAPPARPSRQRSGVRGRAGPRRAVRDPSDLRAAVDEGHAHGVVGARRSSCGCSPSVTASDGVRQQFTTLFDYGVFDKFPRLKVVVLESGGGWIGYWLDRIDAVYGHTFIGTRVPLEHKPSDYFRDRVLDLVRSRRAHDPRARRAVRCDRFMWASDFPHADHTPEYVTDLEELAAALPDGHRRAFLGDNARGLFRIDA